MFCVTVHDCCTKVSPGEEINWQPDPVQEAEGSHYKPLKGVIGKETTDADRPSISLSTQKVSQELQVNFCFLFYRIIDFDSLDYRYVISKL